MSEPATKFFYEVKAVMKISLEEIDLLMSLSEHHYDGYCKSVSKVGGFLYGMKNHALYADDGPPELTLRQREIDTMMKLCEGLQYEDKQFRAMGTLLFDRLWRAHSDISAEWKRLNGK